MGLYGLAASLLVVWSIFLGTTAYYKGRDSRSNEVAEYQAAIKASERLAAEAERKAEALELSHQARLADISQNIVEENARHEAERRRAIAGARALVLRDQPKCPAIGSGGGEAGAGAEGSNGEAICKLPAEVVRDMESLVFDADRDVRQLERAQEVIEEDRRICAAPPVLKPSNP